jgi:hypothetical protein
MIVPRLRLGHLISRSGKWVVNGTRTTYRFTTFPFATDRSVGLVAMSEPAESRLLRAIMRMKA